jgi:hypothetical protein
MFQIVDELGKVNQAIAELEVIAKKLKAELIAQGKGTYEGNGFVAEVQEYDRANISATLVRKLADDDFIAQVTQIQQVKAVVVKAQVAL